MEAPPVGHGERLGDIAHVVDQATETTFVARRLRCPRGESRRASPARRAWFTSSFRLTPRRFRARSSSRATSSSSVRVVRTHQRVLQLTS